MKKNLLAIGLMIAGISAVAQSPRLSLFEEFTGETCNPCAATNPGLNAILSTTLNQSKMVSIKWQVPIPSAPTPTWSLYKTNQADIDWRWKSTSAGAYGYPSQSTPTDAITSGINSAPSGRIDGQHQWTFGATSDHPGYMSDAIIATAQSYTSPFSISMNRSWVSPFSSVTLTVNIQATANFSATGPLIFRLVMIERNIHFATQPGTNGEKDFYDVARAAFPTLQAGTSMAATWTVGQTQTFTISCPIPSYILNKAEVAFVGFIQDDGNKKVAQAALADAIGTADDAKAISASLPAIICTSTISPQVTIKNFGGNAITTLTISQYVDATAGTPYTWSGNLAVGASTTITMSTMTSPAGSHTYSYNITGVNGGADTYVANNTYKTSFISSPSYIAGPVSEAFTSGTFPPLNWGVINADNGTSSWSRNPSVGAYGSNSGAVKYDFYANATVGDVDALVLPATDLSAISMPVLTFDMAYAPYPGGYNDQLEVKVSTNCGASWTTVYTQNATQMSTAPANTNAFTPTATQWKTEVVTLTSYANAPQVLVKFSTINDNGNNLWLDNINLAQSNPTSIKNVSASDLTFEIYPNPTKDEANIKVNSNRSDNVKVTVINTLGQVVYVKNAQVNVGSNLISIDAKEFASGIYNVMIESGSSTLVKKLTVSK